MNWIIAFSLLIALFGCLQPYAGQNQTAGQPQQNITPPQQNATPPVTPPEENLTPSQNETPSQNVTPPPLPPPQEQTPEIPTTDLSIKDLLTQRLDALPVPSGGPYATKNYIWVSGEFEPDVATIEMNPTNTVMFNNKSEKNLIGLAFRVYTPQSGHSFADGIAITWNSSIMLDEFTASGRPFELEFLFPGLERVLKGAVFVNEDDLQDGRNRTLAIYTFEASNAG